MQASLQRHLSPPLFAGPRRLKGVCAAAWPWASPILLWAWSTPSLPSNCNAFPWKVSSRVVPPPPRSEPSMGCEQGPAGATWHGGDAACSQEAPCPRAGLVAGLTVSTLPAVSSMELALTASRVMSERMSSSPTMPL